jgi:pimeloyl-ACP methyl ester carboxylesterase
MKMSVQLNAHRGYASRFLQVDGHHVHVREHGQVGGLRSPALLVHGHFGSARQWSPVMALLGRAMRCVAVDLPGFGRTTPPPRHSTASTAQTLAGIAAAVSDEPVHLIGNSYGATVALWAAAQNPRLVSTLTLISPAVSLAPITRSANLLAAALYRLCLGTQGLRRRLSRMDAGQLAHHLLSASCHDVGSLSRAVVDIARRDARDALRSEWRFAAEAASFRAMAATLLRSVLPTGFSLRRMARQVRVPTLIVWGANDRTLPVVHAQALTKLMPKAKLAVIPATGHAPQLEAPHRTAAIIGSYIASCAA